MNRKIIWLSSLAVALLGVGVVRGQGPDMRVSPPGLQAPPATGSTPLALPPTPGDPGPPLPPGQHYTLSKWIIGERCPGCCGPIGADGPIGSEIYMRTGVSFSIGGGALSQGIDTGWDIEGGARALFFNRDVDAAWTVDIGVTNIFNPANKNAGPVTLQNVPLKTINPTTGQSTTITVPTLDVTPGNLNRTFVNLGGGREVWLMGSADCSHNDLNWRVGWDVGGRWGTEKLELNELQHRTAAVGGVYVGLHSDVEVPCGAVILQAGIRTEWSETFGQILQRENNGDTMDLNLMFTLGIRF